MSGLGIIIDTLGIDFPHLKWEFLFQEKSKYTFLLQLDCLFSV